MNSKWAKFFSSICSAASVWARGTKEEQLGVYSVTHRVSFNEKQPSAVRAAAP